MNMIRKTTMLATAIAALGLTGPVHAKSTARLLAPFVGIWSNTEMGCQLLKQGKLDKMDTAHATRFGILEISTNGLDWIYSSGSFARCAFIQGETKVVGKQIIAPACCDCAGDSSTANERIFIASAGSKMEILYEFRSWSATKIRCPGIGTRQ